MRVPAYTKTIVALVGAVLAVVTPILGADDFLTTTDIVQMAVGILTAFGVFALPNSPVPGKVEQDPEVDTRFRR
jgi:Na+/H+ antiporter NhaD/arsenite permease-like protein